MSSKLLLWSAEFSYCEIELFHGDREQLTLVLQLVDDGLGDETKWEASCAAGSFLDVIVFFCLCCLFWLDSFFLTFPRSNVTVQDAVKEGKKKVSWTEEITYPENVQLLSFWNDKSLNDQKNPIPSVVTRIVQILDKSYQMGNKW